MYLSARQEVSGKAGEGIINTLSSFGVNSNLQTLEGLTCPGNVSAAKIHSLRLNFKHFLILIFIFYKNVACICFDRVFIVCLCSTKRIKNHPS